MTKITKKSQQINIVTIVIAIIALIVFVILIAIFTGVFDKFNPNKDIEDLSSCYLGNKFLWNQYPNVSCVYDLDGVHQISDEQFYQGQGKLHREPYKWHKANPCELCSKNGDCSQEVSEGKCVCDGEETELIIDQYEVDLKPFEKIDLKLEAEYKLISYEKDPYWYYVYICQSYFRNKYNYRAKVGYTRGSEQGLVCHNIELIDSGHNTISIMDEYIIEWIDTIDNSPKDFNESYIEARKWVDSEESEIRNMNHWYRVNLRITESYNKTSCISSHLKTLKDLSIPELRKAYDEEEYKKSDIVTELIKRIDGDT